jgi:hypothetical protein
MFALNYVQTVFKLVRVGFLCMAVVSLLFGGLAFADIILSLHFGYTWQVVIFSVAGALLMCLGYVLVGVIRWIAAKLDPPE